MKIRILHLILLTVIPATTMHGMIKSRSFITHTNEDDWEQIDDKQTSAAAAQNNADQSPKSCITPPTFVTPDETPDLETLENHPISPASSTESGDPTSLASLSREHSSPPSSVQNATNSSQDPQLPETLTIPQLLNKNNNHSPELHPIPHLIIPIPETNHSAQKTLTPQALKALCITNAMLQLHTAEKTAQTVVHKSPIQIIIDKPNHSPQSRLRRLAQTPHEENLQKNITIDDHDTKKEKDTKNNCLECCPCVPKNCCVIL